MTRSLMILAALAALPACVAIEKAPGEPARVAEGDGTCNAAAAQYHVGHKATAEMGAAIQRDSGATAFRWGAPGSAWTMDYRTNRVNVRYDEAMTITAVTCG